MLASHFLYPSIPPDRVVIFKCWGAGGGASGANDGGGGGGGNAGAGTAIGGAGADGIVVIRYKYQN